MATYNELEQRIKELKSRTGKGSISPRETFDLMDELLSKTKGVDMTAQPLVVVKSYDTLALANADRNPINPATNKPLALGQLISITADGANNAVYRLASLGSDGSPTWEKQAELGDMTNYAKQTDLVQLAGEINRMNVYDGTNIITGYSKYIGDYVDGYTPTGATSIVRENVNGYLELKLEHSLACYIGYSNNKLIDFTNLRYIEVDMEQLGVGNTGALRTRVVISNNQIVNPETGTTIKFISGKFDRQKYLIDVSDKTGLQYLIFAIGKSVNDTITIPHLKVYNIDFISMPVSDIPALIEELAPEKFRFAMGYDADPASISKITVSESTGMITFPSAYRIIDRQGILYLGASGKSVSAICTSFTTGLPVASSYGYLVFNKITSDIRVIYWSDWSKITDDWLTLALVKRSSGSTTVIGNIHLNTPIAWQYENAVGADLVKDVVARNVDMQPAVNAAIANKYSSGVTKKRFNFLHFTDNHADAKTTANVIKYLNYTPQLDMAVVTGDILSSDFTSQKTIIAQMTASVKPILPILGNHDVGNSLNIASCGDHTQVYDSLIKPFNDKGWIDAQGKNYWYKDFSDYKIRVIALYEFDEPLDINASDPTKYKVFRGYRVYSQTQINWLISLLSSTPTDYHTILLTHQNPQVDSTGTLNAGWNTYNIGIGTPSNYINGNIIPDLINAWQNGIAINQTYSFLNEAAYLTSLSVVADFTSRGVGNFIGYFYGHSHVDIIGTLGSYPSQNVFSCVATISSGINNEWNDLPRVADTKSEDAFNVITVDTANKKVYVVRIGANYTIEMKERKTLVVDY